MEQIVKRTASRQEVVIKDVLLGLTILCGFMTFFLMRLGFLILFGVFALLYYFKNRQISTEYEYLYLDGTLEIDRVCFQSKRKKMAVIDTSEILVVAPEGSQKALAYDHGQMTVMRFCGDPQEKVFLMMARMKEKSKQVKIFWQPNQELLEEMKHQIADRVFTE